MVILGWLGVEALLEMIGAGGLMVLANGLGLLIVLRQNWRAVVMMQPQYILPFLLTLNIFYLVNELDAKVIVELLGNPLYVNNVIYPILDDCMMLVSRFQQIRIKHCFREANRCADSLIRMSFIQDADFSSFVSPPMDMIDVYEDDLNGMYFNWICLEPIVLS